MLIEIIVVINFKHNATYHNLKFSPNMPLCESLSTRECATPMVTVSCVELGKQINLYSNKASALIFPQTCQMNATPLK